MISLLHMLHLFTCNLIIANYVISQLHVVPGLCRDYEINYNFIFVGVTKQHDN